MTRMGAVGTGWLVAGMLAVGSVPAAAAQAETGWLPWIGCWQPEPAAGEPAGETPTVCFVATAEAGAVDVITLDAGEIVSRERLRADGSRRALEEGGCTGSESAAWSADGRRLYLESALSCEGLPRQSTGMFAMVGPTEWLDIQAVSAGRSAAERGVRVVRYRAASQSALEAHGIVAASPERALVLQTARQAAAAPVDLHMVTEAVARVDNEVVEAWLIESQARIALSAAQLVALDEAGVPTSVIDLMVALANPQRFAIDHAGRASALPAAGRAGLSEDERARRAMARPYYGSRRPGSWYGWDPYYGYGYGGYYGYGYGGRPGWGSFYGGYTPVIVIIREPVQDGQAQGRLRAVRGRGYTTGTSSAGSSSPSPSRGRPASGSASGTSSSGSATSQPASSGSSGRTARPRSSGSDPEPEL
jgi:hypothetical protein